jgi:hypothetical protein
MQSWQNILEKPLIQNLESCNMNLLILQRVQTSDCRNHVTSLSSLSLSLSLSRNGINIYQLSTEANILVSWLANKYEISFVYQPIKGNKKN